LRERSRDGEIARDNNCKADDLEKTLFKAVDKLKKDLDAAEYKHQR